jgi:DNA-binding MurR/RpiR family transcriptional regulator
MKSEEHMGPCLIKMEESLDSLSNKEHVLAKYILHNVQAVSKMTITELSKASHSSPATIVRYTKFLGFTGYRDFTKALYSEAQNEYGYPENVRDLENIAEDDTSIEATIQRVSKGNIEAIENSLKVIDCAAIEQAVDMLDKATKVYIYSIGGSAIAAKDAVFKLQRIGIECQAFDSVHDQILSASILNKNDVALYFSYSGESKDLLKSLKIAKENKAHTIAITKYSDNTLSKLVDLNIHHAAVAEGVRTNSTKSRIAQLNIVDILFTRLAEKRVNKLERFYELTNDVFLNDKNLLKAK